MINGKYLQFLSIISMDKNFADDLVGKLIDLSFILKIEEINGYNKKFNSLFNVISYLFCDFHNFIKVENQIENLEKLFILVLDGIDSCNPFFSMVSHKIIFYFCSKFLEARELFKKSNAEFEKYQYFRIIYERFSGKFYFFFEKIFKLLCDGYGSNISLISQSFLSLIILFSDQYLKIIESFLIRIDEKEINKKNK